MKEGNQLGKLLFLVVPVGLAAGILLPYAVLNSDEIASVFHRGKVSIAPEIEIVRHEVRAQPLAAPIRVVRPASLSVEMKPAGRWYRKSVRSKRNVKPRHPLDVRTRKRLQQADNDAWKAADRLLHAERTGMM